MHRLWNSGSTRVPSSLISRPARTGTGGLGDRERAVQDTASASTSRSTLNFTEQCRLSKKQPPAQPAGDGSNVVHGGARARGTTTLLGESLAGHRVREAGRRSRGSAWGGTWNVI